MLLIKHLGDFSSRLIRESILYWVLGIDVIALVTTYYTRINLPVWVFWSLPVLATFLASFNIYRRGASDIRIIFVELQDLQFQHTGGHEDLTQMFGAMVRGHLVNYGLHAGVLEDLSIKAGVNGIYDKFVVKHLNFNIQLSPLLSNTHLLPHSPYRDHEVIELPFVIGTGQIRPFAIRVVVSIVSFDQIEIEKSIKWLEHINLQINCRVRQQDGVRNQKMSVLIPTRSLMPAVEESKQSRKKWEKHSKRQSTV